MPSDGRIPTHTPESREFAARTQVAMSLSARLNALAFEDVEQRRQLLGLLFGGPVPESLSVLPPFHCDYGLGTTFGERVVVNQDCYVSDLGGISIGDRVLIGPRVTLTTAGHPAEVADRFAAITHAPITIGDDVWLGAAVTVLPGVTIGRGAVVGAGTVVASDVPPLSVVTGAGHVVRRRLDG